MHDLLGCRNVHSGNRHDRQIAAIYGGKPAVNAAHFPLGALSVDLLRNGRSNMK